ncbi:FAD-dependent monooxygenase [Roseovarius sp. ZX-A-9]|uniref:FAD-dependent monooxygenase n=1 Tax=Roseovarius sp. ZX-A-9 TaxID=3014783 RepID=UPI002330C253|nr:FAD-dependent monooxygenase [Roseovarius sp. ZX-A-9]
MTYQTSKTPARAVEADVIICGSGPVGLSFAYLLGRAGIRAVLLEKRPGTTTLPKGQYVHSQTAELYLQWGVWDMLDTAGWEIQRSNGQGFYVNVANGPVAQVRSATGSDAEYRRKWEQLTPVYPRKIPASDYEAAILHKASQWPSLTTYFNTEAHTITPLDDRVEVEATDRITGEQLTFSARYLIASDGAHSVVRNQIGQGEDYGPAFTNQILVEFEAELKNTLGKDGFFHSFVLDPRYPGWFGSEHPETGLWRYSFRHDEDELPEEAAIIERLRGALGMPDLPVRIEKTYRFDYTTGLLRNWREGNILFAGDAAHWHSPWGGFGANSGVQDANNLSWKLALVLKGLAGDELIDSYVAERKSKALQTVKSATYNSLHYQAIAQSAILGEPDMPRTGQISQEARDFLEERMMSHGGNAVLHTGYQLGTTYNSSAVIRDGATPPTPRLAEYIESTTPGARAPHIWLTGKDANRISLVTMWGMWFSLVVTRQATEWQRIIDTYRDPGLPLHLVDLSAQGEYVPEEPKFTALYRGEDDCGMVLVRPDGFVARRFYGDAATEGADFLADTLHRILGQDVSARVLAPSVV